MTAGQVEKNKALMEEMVRIFETGDLSNVAVVIDTTYIDHQGLDGTALKGPDGFCRVVMAARTAFPDLRVSIEDLISEDDRVVARLRWHGTRPTGQRVDRETIDIVRVAKGRAVEHLGRATLMTYSPESVAYECLESHLVWLKAHALPETKAACVRGETVQALWSCVGNSSLRDRGQIDSAGDDNRPRCPLAWQTERRIPAQVGIGSASRMR